MIVPTFEDVVAFLDYPDDFWEFVKPRTRRIDATVPGNEIFFKTLLKFDDNGNIINIRVMVPYIIDLYTACVNVHEFKHAYDMYTRLNTFVDESDRKYEDDAVKTELKFKRMILKKK